MINVSDIVRLHDQATLFWHNPSAPFPEAANPFDRLVLEQHHANFELWHLEDAARDLQATDHQIAACKKSIDQANQRRNDLVEAIDVELLTAVRQIEDLPLHSETPGQMIDRLSILSLKHFHTEEETRRVEAGLSHQRRNLERLAILSEQRDDLANCLAVLWAEVLAGSRRFKLYRQLKMYNDPELNPVLYGGRRN